MTESVRNPSGERTGSAAGGDDGAGGEARDPGAARDGTTTETGAGPGADRATALERETATGDETGDAAADDPVLAVDGLRKEFGSGEDGVTAVDGVDLAVDRGEVVGVLGPNGAGKTTTIKCILGLILPTAGTVEVAGVDARERPRDLYRHVGAMLEGARNVYWRLTVRENLEFFAAIGGQSPGASRERHDDLLAQFGLADVANDTVNDLSRGQKQKVALAATLARDTDVVFLDEPTLGLDVESSFELRRELRRLADDEDTTVILSSHDMGVIEEICDRVVVLSGGRVIADDPVADLVQLFRSQEFRVTVGDRVPGRVRASLERDYDADDWVERGDRTSFAVTLPDEYDLYEVLDRLREADLPLEDVDGRDPNLESVFLEITERDGGEPLAAPGGDPS